MPEHHTLNLLPPSPSQDPQQRLLLECCADAVLRLPNWAAGAVEDSSASGVYIGASSMDYSKLATEHRGGEVVSAFSATGDREIVSKFEENLSNLLPTPHSTLW